MCWEKCAKKSRREPVMWLCGLCVMLPIRQWNSSLFISVASKNEGECSECLGKPCIMHAVWAFQTFLPSKIKGSCCEVRCQNFCSSTLPVFSTHAINACPKGYNPFRSSTEHNPQHASMFFSSNAKLRTTTTSVSFRRRLGNALAVGDGTNRRSAGGRLRAQYHTEPAANAILTFSLHCESPLAYQPA